MAQPLTVVPTLRESYNRRSRIWLKVTLSTTAWENVIKNVKNILQKSVLTVHKDLLKYVVPNIGGGVNFVIPLTGAIPVVTFKNTYDRMVQDLDFHTRAMADLMGALGRGAGDFITDIGKESPAFSGQIQGFGNMVTKVSKFVQAFGGNVMAPKVWRNGDVDDLRFGGRTGFENIHEYNYYKMIELIIQGILTPASYGKITKVSQLLNNLPILQDGVLDNLTLTLLQPNNIEMDIDVVIGTALPMPIDMPMKLEEESFPLLALNKVYMTSAEINYGTDDGRGFDINGVSRIADFTLEFTIKEFQSVTDGMKRQREAMDFANLSLKYATPITPSVVDIANSVMFTTMNIFLLGAVPGYNVAQALGVAGLPSFVAQKSLLGWRNPLYTDGGRMVIGS